MLCDGANHTTMRFFGKKLVPCALMSDHSAGCRHGLTKTWPEAPFGQCWPHIKRKFSEGAFCSKKHPFFGTIGKHLDAVHLCQTVAMRDYVIHAIGKAIYLRIYLKYT